MSEIKTKGSSFFRKQGDLPKRTTATPINEKVWKSTRKDVKAVKEEEYGDQSQRSKKEPFAFCVDNVYLSSSPFFSSFSSRYLDDALGVAHSNDVSIEGGGTRIAGGDGVHDLASTGVPSLADRSFDRCR